MVATRFVVDQAGPASLALLRYAIGFCCLVPFVLVAAPRARFARRDLLPIGAPRHRAVRPADRAPELRASLHPVGARGADLRHVPALDDGDRGRARPRAAQRGPDGRGAADGRRGRRWPSVRRRAGSPAAPHEWIGEVAVLASALCGAACSVLYRPYLARYPALPVSAFAMLASVGFLAVLAAPEGFFGALPRFSAGRLARRPVHRRGQRHRLLSLALGAPSRERHRGDRLSRAQPDHRRVARRAGARRADVTRLRARPRPGCRSASGSPTAKPVRRHRLARMIPRTAHSG